ncbi:hypothetical protein [Nocardioides sp.]|uniref:hypothetical protein n=1 Tax=Nocardioides sp. TaxID=35761 RepID=UPI0039E23A23
MLLLAAVLSLAVADDPYVDAAEAGWRDGPVYLSPEAGALSPTQASALADRIEGWRDDVYVAVLPATALENRPGAEPERALTLLDELEDRTPDGIGGIVIASFGGIGTFAASYDPLRDGDEQVGQLMADAVADHTVGQQAEVVEEVLDELGAPGGPGGSGGFPRGWLVVALLAVLAAAGATYVWLRRCSGRRPSGERWGGRADYRPAWATYDDERDTLEKRLALAREDVTRLGEELDRADVPGTDPVVRDHLQAALDAYADCSRRVETVTSDEELRRLGDVVEYARWRHACARALLAGAPPPPRRVPCFRDPTHGVSVADVMWAPPGGVPRPVPVCRACFEEMTP